jgi:hypothetical protein
MTSSVVTSEQESIRQVPIWEDFLDIFYAPAAVFTRRRDGRFGLALLVLTLVFTFLTISSQSALAPIYEAEFNRSIAQALEANPEITAEQLGGMRSFGKIMAILGGVVFIPLTALLIGAIVRLIGALFDARLTFKLAIMIALYAQFPRLLQQILSVAQAFLLPAESLTSVHAIGFSPARLMDIEATSQATLTLLARFDLFTIWATVILASGLRVVGRVPGGRAYLAAGLVWVLVTLFPLFGVLRAG